MPTWKPPTAPTAPVRQAIADWLRTYLDDSVVSDQRAPARVKRAIMKVPATAVNKVLPLTGWTETPQPLGVVDIPSPAAIMIGRGSPLFNREMAAKFAEALRKIPVAGRQSPKVVQNLWDRFRTFLGPDNRLRQEISDEGLRVDTRFPNEAERWTDFEGSPITVEHSELSRAYPGLMDSLNFRNSRLNEYKGDAFYRRTSPDVRRNAAGEIVLTRPRFGDITRLMKVSPEAMNQTHRANIVHELQHAVQIAEGFAPGSNPFMFHLLPELEQNAFRSKVKQETLDALDRMAQNRTSMPKGWESISGNSKIENAIPLEFYFRQPGEAEARMVSRRLLKPSPETVPLADYDIPLNRLYRPRR